MEAIMSLGTVMAELWDYAALGFEMWDRHAIWLWCLPPFWSIAACLMLDKLERESEDRDRFYLANAERNLPRLQELIKNRSTEVLDLQAMDRDRPQRVR